MGGRQRRAITDGTDVNFLGVIDKNWTDGQYSQGIMAPAVKMEPPPSSLRGKWWRAIKRLWAPTNGALNVTATRIIFRIEKMEWMDTLEVWCHAIRRLLPRSKTDRKTVGPSISFTDENLSLRVKPARGTWLTCTTMMRGNHRSRRVTSENGIEFHPERKMIHRNGLRREKQSKKRKPSTTNKYEMIDLTPFWFLDNRSSSRNSFKYF